jgi:hypothetical protein
MDGKLIVAAILSVIGAGLIALFIGLSLYTVVLLPAFIIVLVVCIWGGQRSKAVWLGFLLFILCMSSVWYSHGIIFLSTLICLVSFFLVFSSFYSHENLKQAPPSVLRLFTPLFILLALVVQLYEWSLHKEAIDLLFYHPSQLYMPRFYIYIYLVSPLVVYLSIMLLVIFGNRFTYYLLTPVILVTNLLFALENVFKFSLDHLSYLEITSFFGLLYQGYIIKEHLIYDVFIGLSLLMTFLFMAKYEKKSLEN